ncbi:DUF6157 family protein [Parasphingorhabdus pacifica]
MLMPSRTHGVPAARVRLRAVVGRCDYRRGMERVDYADTFIAVAEDSVAEKATAPPLNPENPSIAARTYRMLVDHPYEFTSGDVIFTVYADRNGIPEVDRAMMRAEFYSTSRACLRSSDLPKRYGWGVHADSSCRLALYGVGTEEYAEFVSGRRRSEAGESITVTRAMRGSRRAS